MIATWAPPTYPQRSAAPIGCRPRCAHSAPYRHRHCGGAIRSDRLRRPPSRSSPRMGGEAADAPHPEQHAPGGCDPIPPRWPGALEQCPLGPGALMAGGWCQQRGGVGATGGGEANKPRFISVTSSSESAPASCSLQASSICGRAFIARARFSTSLGRRRPIYSFPPTKSCGTAQGSKGLGHTCTRQ